MCKNFHLWLCGFYYDVILIHVVQTVIEFYWFVFTIILNLLFRYYAKQYIYLLHLYVLYLSF